MENQISSQTSYMTSVFDPRQRRKIVKMLRHGQTYSEYVYGEGYKDVVHPPLEFDTIVGRGMSGALIVPEIARVLKCGWLIIRKPGDKSHSTKIGEGNLGKRWIFMDDLIESGETFNQCAQGIDKIVRAHNLGSSPNYQFKTEFAGIVLYNGMRTFTPKQADDMWGTTLWTSPFNVAKRKRSAVERDKEYKATLDNKFRLIGTSTQSAW